MTASPTRPRAVRLIATDLDGTLLRPDRTISERTRSAFRRAREAGIVTVIATARPPLTARSFARAAGIDGLAICSNGALVYDLDARAVVAHRPMTPKAAAEAMLGMRARLPDVCFGCVTLEEFWAEPAYVALSHREDHGRTREEMTTASVDAFLRTPITKLTLRHATMRPAELLAIVRELSPAGCEADISGAPFVELVAKGVSKASALAELCERRGIAAAEVMAFGDAPNDLGMLAWAGRGVAVANAYPEVLAAADEVTAANKDDGVAAAIERLLSA